MLSLAFGKESVQPQSNSRSAELSTVRETSEDSSWWRPQAEGNTFEMTVQSGSTTMRSGSGGEIDLDETLKKDQGELRNERRDARLGRSGGQQMAG